MLSMDLVLVVMVLVDVSKQHEIFVTNIGKVKEKYAHI
jgi:hypothetical protein